jgi:predicted O-linked N-acetylglucosamine transferase (SPINDLY family)
MNDDTLARRIRDDRIDILFDLAGHTAGNRLLAFARKPAPIQITWLDYVGTTGLAAMDYIIADLRQIPPALESDFSEKVLRMPDDYICYDPPENAPDIVPPPALSVGFVTFGCFNILAKITPQMIGVWAQILQRVPGSRLMFKNLGLDEPATRERFEKLFTKAGIAPDRLEFLGWSPSAEVLACYQQVDIGLDTFPYNGGLTTCEAIWMGVPVVTCAGEIFASRHGLAHLTAAGLSETVAENLEQYVEMAVTLAGDLPRLRALRASMRERVAASPLCDDQRFAANFSTLMREIWRRWVESHR